MRLWVAVVLLLAVVDNCHSSDCGTTITLTTDSGFIKYPPNGGTYGNLKKVCWIIDSGRPIYITFTKFDYEFNKDFLYVHNGGNEATPLIGASTGTDLPGPLHPSSNVAFIRSVTDFAYGLDGFELQWHYTDEKGGCVFSEKYHKNGATLNNVCTKIVCEDTEWKFIGNNIDPKCSKCFVRNDPHFTTFDKLNYDWHGQCKYSITQEGRKESPGYYVYGQFKECLTGAHATCLDEITFQNDKESVITFDAGPIVKFNSKVVPLTSTPQRYDFAGKTFFAWVGDFTLARATTDCVCIVGSQGLMIQYCGWDINIWATDSLKKSLYGLCGYYDGNPANDYTERDNKYTPISDVFAHNWKIKESTPCTLPPLRSKLILQTTCEADPSIDTYRQDCANIVRDLDMGDDRNITIENCAFDRCIIINSGSTNPSPDDWLLETLKSAERTVVIKDLTAATDAPTPPPTQPPIPTHSPSDLAKQNVIVQIVQRVGP